MTSVHFFVEAKNRVESEISSSTAGVRQYVQSFLTSRISMALAAALFVAFASTAIYAPDRLVPLAQLNLQQQGLLGQAPTLDLSAFNVAPTQQRQQVQDFVSKATPYVVNAYSNAKAKYPRLPLWINLAGAAISFAALLYTMQIQVRAVKEFGGSIAD